jgi:uncharacterized protein YcfL
MKKFASLLLGLGLLSLSACSSEKKEQTMSQEVVVQEEAEPTKKELSSITQVAENDVVSSELEKTEKSGSKEV